MINKFYFGDNLHVRREHLAEESVDLVYLDPPFNSNANHYILIWAILSRASLYAKRGVEVAL